MSRLTKKNGKPCTSCESLDCLGDCRGLFALYNKLAHYEDLEEQGRLIEVIRCKDCIRHDNSSVPEGSGWCDEHERMTGDDEYCSYAVDLLAELKGTEEWAKD